MLKIMFFLVLCLQSFKSNAFLITTYNNEKLDSTRPTHILVTGTGTDLGTQFQQIVTGKALKYSQQYPHEQIVLMAADEPDTCIFHEKTSF